MTRTRQDALGGEVVAALESCWVAIRARHPELPPAVLVTGAGTLGPGAGVRLGHFAAGRWQTNSEGPVSEVFVGGEGLGRGAPDVLTTLLHEAAHALADRRHIKDTSRQGRYHNRRFKALAEELGLQVDHDPALGWSSTTLPDSSAERYVTELMALERALTAYRAGEPRRPSRSAGSVGCVCGCGRRIRIAPRVLARGPVICGLCGERFEVREAGG